MSKRILIIDDEESVRNSFVMALEDLDCQVDTAGTGENGVEMTKDGSGYDLIFLDLKMPGLNGAETLRELRRVDKTMPVYIITAYSSEFFSELKSLREEGIYFELVRKPIGTDEIVEITKAVLS